MEIEHEEICTISYDHGKKPVGESERGTRLGTDELCFYCWRSMCWAIAAVWSKKYAPTDPFETEKDL